MFAHGRLRRGTAAAAALAVGLFWLAAAGAADPPGGLRFSKRLLMVNPNEGCAVGDVDRDGRLDVVAGTHWYAAPQFAARPVRDIPEVSLGFAPNDFYANNGDHLYDVDGDGRNDLVWGKGHDYGVYWWQQGPPQADGTTTWTERLIDDSWSQAHSIAWADLDGDGKGEIVTGKRVRGHGGRDPGAAEGACLYYYRWEADTGQFLRHTIGAPGEGIGTGMQICVADLNGDDRPDIAVAGKTGTWILFNEGVSQKEGE